jgi:GNAT superfamily N-acetyltransferase
MKILDVTHSMDDHLVELTDLLQNSINSGASVGFLAHAEISQLLAFWKNLMAQAKSGHLRILGSFEDSHLVGTVTLLMDALPNGVNRAEVKKLLVHTNFRGRGIGTALMKAIEELARQENLELLVLDTETDSKAESLYICLGWNRLGSIPRYALSPAGKSNGSTFFWKSLEY